jgi:GH24 family phage-related lysozyme (muramidase)
MTVPNMSLALRKMADILRTDDFERTIPYLYLDSLGILTVGVGHNLRDNPIPSPLSLSFTVARLERKKVAGGDVGIPITDKARIGMSATRQEIQNDIDFLKRHAGLKKFFPVNLRDYTTLELTSLQITLLFEDDLNYFLNKVCRKEFTPAAFDAFPLSCQMALLDIAFNCGSFGKFNGHFVPAIKGTGLYAGKSWTERWTEAANYSRRGAVGYCKVQRKWGKQHETSNSMHVVVYRVAELDKRRIGRRAAFHR